MTKPRDCGALSWDLPANQKNDPISTEKMLIQDQMTNPTTTTMGKP
jgi:hypothetical protein